MGGGEKGTGKRRGAAGGWREGDERERKEARWDQWARNAEGREREVERERVREGVVLPARYAPRPRQSGRPTRHEPGRGRRG